MGTPGTEALVNHLLLDAQILLYDDASYIRRQRYSVVVKVISILIGQALNKSDDRLLSIRLRTGCIKCSLGIVLGK